MYVLVIFFSVMILGQDGTPTFYFYKKTRFISYKDLMNSSMKISSQSLFFAAYLFLEFFSKISLFFILKDT
jgi:hypothetical protein